MRERKSLYAMIKTIDRLKFEETKNKNKIRVHSIGIDLQFQFWWSLIYLHRVSNFIDWFRLHSWVVRSFFLSRCNYLFGSFYCQSTKKKYQTDKYFMFILFIPFLLYSSLKARNIFFEFFVVNFSSSFCDLHHSV